MLTSMRHIDNNNHLRKRGLTRSNISRRISVILFILLQVAVIVFMLMYISTYQRGKMSNNTGTKFANTHFMTTSWDGGIGNQMFSVANLLGAAHYHGYAALINSSMDIAKYFDLPNLSQMIFTNVLDFRAKRIFKYDKNIAYLNHSYNYTFQKQFQSWRYFDGASEIVRRAFKFKENIIKQATDYIQGVCPRDCWKVGIHVRRGDFLNPKWQKLGLAAAPVQYINTAMEHFRRKYRHVHFIVISNDNVWCSANLNTSDVTVSPFNSPEVELAVVSLCDSVIVTSGSFGWWGGWLSAGGDVVYWKGFPVKGTKAYNNFNSTDYYPSHWIGFD